MMEYFIKAHGLSQLEIKINYPLIPEKKISRYRMTSYFFIPEQLGVNDSSFSTERILTDLTVHTRFTTPRISIEDLVDPAWDTSPVIRLKKLWQRTQKNREWKKLAEYEIKTLVNIALSQTGKGMEDVPLPRYETFCDAADSIAAVLMDLLQELNPGQSKSAAQVKQSLIWGIEALSGLFCEFYLDCLRQWAGDQEKQELYCRYEQSLSGLMKIRKKFGWVLPENLNTRKAELLIYRSHKLKKWAHESLYLSILPSRAAQRVGQFLLGLAAVVAMAFALTATLLSAKWFPEGSIYWAIVAVLAYSLKDRIKENLRFLFLRISPFLVADRTQGLRDPRGGLKCGKIRESVGFIEKLDDSVKEYRRAGKDRLSLGLMKENILKCKREFRIKSASLFANHSRLEGITDIIRLDISSWLQKMDGTKEVLNYRSRGKIKDLKSNRVYHINFILLVEDRDSPESRDISRYRIIMGQKGIIRIDEVLLPEPEALS
ncbi:MAG: hypothetical protein PQJ50_12275 [Spirochaetales bacterium]|nr:hypothetical protein [Spirochaetales bacterium]